MTNENTIQPSRLFWRWTLITAEFLVVVFIVFVATIGGRENEFTHSVPVSIFARVADIAWLFLIFGSPFLFKSQKLLAIIGWFIALAGILVVMLLH